MKRKILKSDDAKTPIQIIGISSYNKDYRISWEINKMLNINLSKINDYIISKANQPDIHFGIFSCTDKDDVSYLLIGNKQGGTVISEKYKNIDFFLIINENDFSPTLTAVSLNLKNSKLINGIFVLKTGTKIKKLMKNYIF